MHCATSVLVHAGCPYIRLYVHRIRHLWLCKASLHDALNLNEYAVCGKSGQAVLCTAKCGPSFQTQIFSGLLNACCLVSTVAASHFPCSLAPITTSPPSPKPCNASDARQAMLLFSHCLTLVAVISRLVGSFVHLVCSSFQIKTSNGSVYCKHCCAFTCSARCYCPFRHVGAQYRNLRKF